MPNPLTPDQLAEGARLLATAESFPLLCDCESFRQMVEASDALTKWSQWLRQHGATMLKMSAAAHRVAEVEGCVRDAIKPLTEEESYLLGVSCKTPVHDYHDGVHAGFARAVERIKQFAARHNIDLENVNVR